MANFKTHITVGTISSFLVTIIFWRHNFFPNVFSALLSSGLGIIGSVFPDIDAKKSIPTRIIISLLSLVSLLVVFIGLKRLNIGLGASIIISIISYIFVGFLLPALLSLITYHRGLIHSIPMAILLTLLLIVYFDNVGYSLNDSLLMGGFFCGGFLIHLVLDEIYSVDILGVKIKSSFGTACQIFSFSQPIRYIVLYCLIGYIYFTHIVKLSI